MHAVVRQYVGSNAAMFSLSRVPGFVAFEILDVGHGHLVTYSLYESKTGAEESTKKAAAWAAMSRPETAISERP
jgi:hypothetical protein